MSKPNGWHRKNKNTAAEAARNAKYASPEHKAARRQIRALLEQGVTLACWRCGERITPGAWHVGHDDVQVNLTRGAECRPCNLKAAASKGAKVANAKRRLGKFNRPSR